jgi:2-methylisocitrate lyase-like PEP mutase family enzyme
MTFAELADAGAQRVSVGGALAWASVGALVEAARRLLDEGDFSLLGSAPPVGWLA